MKLVFAALGFALLAGCVSVESTKAMLESGNDQLVSEAEKTIVNQALYNRQISTAERIQYVKLTKNPEVLIDICRHSGDKKVQSVAVRQIDFSQKGAFFNFIKEFGDDIVKFEFDGGGKEVSDMDALTAELAGRDERENDKLILWMLNAATMEDMIAVFRNLEQGKISCGVLEAHLAKKLARTATSEGLLFELLSGKMCDHLDSQDKSVALGKLTDQGKLMSLCCDSRFSKEKALFQSVREDTVCEFIRSDKRLAKIGETTEANMLSRVRDNKKLARALIQREDPEGAQSVVTALAQRSQMTLAGVAAIARNAQIKEWAMAAVTDKNVIKQMILSKHVNDVQKVQLIGKLEIGDVDEKTYAAATSETVKRALLRKLSPQAIAAVRKADRGNCEKMIEAAKAKSAETFQLGGFYLGMPFDDVDRLVGYWHPKYINVEEKDDILYELYVPFQDSPFCRADADTGKVIEFNFGAKMLETWFKFKGKDSASRAAEYSAQNGIYWLHRYVEEKEKIGGSNVSIPIRVSRMNKYGEWVTEYDGSEVDEDAKPRDVAIAQFTYEWKSNEKQYRLTYFGWRNIGDAMTGDPLTDKRLIRQAESAFAYISAEEGVLRAKIEKAKTTADDELGKDFVPKRKDKPEEVALRLMVALQRGLVDDELVQRSIIRKSIAKFNKGKAELAAEDFPADVKIKILRVVDNETEGAVTDKTDNAMLFWQTERNGKPVIKERLWEMVKEGGDWKMFY